MTLRRPTRVALVASSLALVVTLLPTAPSWSAADTTSPGRPAGLRLVAVPARGTIIATWVAATDNVGVTGYRVYLSAVPAVPTASPEIGRTPRTAWTTNTLRPGTYWAAVAAFDAAGNAGPPSATGRIVLAAPPALAGNLLTANQASVEAGTQGFEVSTGSVVFLRSTTYATSGAASLAIVTKAVGPAAVRTARAWTPVTAGAAYSSSIDVRTSSAVTPGHRVCVKLRWWDVGGKQVAMTNGAWTAVRATGWTRVLAAAQVAPVGAVTVSTSLLIATAALNDTFYADRWGLWRRASVPAWTLPTTSPGAVAVVLGDSYEQGSGGTTPLSRWSTLALTQLGYRELNYGRGGSGYATAGVAPTACGYGSCPSIYAMTLPAITARPSLVILSGGRNDLPLMLTNPGLVHAAITNTIRRLRASLPKARIIVISPMWDSITPQPNLVTMSGWVQAAAATAKVTFVGGAEQWLVGHPEWIAADHVHPDDLGHQQIAYRLLKALG